MSSYDNVLDRLDHVKRSGDTAMASCPAYGHGNGHGDRNQSLSVAYKDGQVLIKCHASCHVQDVMAGLQMEWEDLWDEPIADPRGVKVAEFTYQRSDGTPHFMVERWQKNNGKTFIQRVPGEQKAGYPQDFLTCIYGIPEVLAACKVGGTVYFVEGEKCVHAARQMGLVATTSPNGVAGWRDYFVRWLKGAGQVIVIADNDEPGRKYAAQVCASVRGVGIPCITKAIALDDPKADLYDHMKAGFGPEDLRPVNLNRLRPREITARQLMTTDYPPVTWAVHDILPAGLALFGGPPKIAKSFTALDFALGVAVGGESLHHFECEQGSVLYLSLDNDSERRMQHRVNYFFGGDPPKELPVQFHFDFGTGAEALESVREWALDEREAGQRPLLVVIDTLVRVEPEFEGSGQGNGYSNSTSILSRWARMAQEQDIAVVAIHHDRKSTDDDWLNRFTGSRGLTATAQTLMMLDAKRGAKEGMLRIAGRDIETGDVPLRRTGWVWTFDIEADSENL
jgi:hypothetical protein